MIVAIVQARMGSSRLPGKVLAELAGRPALHHVLERAKAIPGVDRVCCAIPSLSADDPLVGACEAVGVAAIRGPEQDVLGRYHRAAEAADASVVLRITADCPALDPEACRQALVAYQKGGVDYVSNTAPRSWPKGLDVEVFSREALERAHREASAPYAREHVTPYIREAAGYRRDNVALPTDECASWRWTLDYPEDLAFFREFFARLPNGPLGATFAELRRVFEAEPGLAAINGHRV